MSTENAVLVTQSHRWPLLIDPHLQGESWLQAKEASHGLRTLCLTDDNMLRMLEQQVRMGTPVLFHEVGESLHTALEPLLRKDIQHKNGRSVVRIGDAEVDYDPNFRLYLSTRLANPHYLPEVQTQVAVINFMVTQAGLEEQMLSDTVRHERPELEEERDSVVVSLAKDRRLLSELQEKILGMLQASEGNVLDDTALIQALDASRITSASIKQRVGLAEETEAEINASRAQFTAVPRRAAGIFFEMSALPHLDPMYQYSLAYFKQMFSHCLKSAAPAEDPQVPPTLLNVSSLSWFSRQRDSTSTCNSSGRQEH